MWQNWLEQLIDVWTGTELCTDKERYLFGLLQKSLKADKEGDK